MLKQPVEGRVHKWERRWVVVKKGTQKAEVQLELLRWIITGVLRSFVRVKVHRMCFRHIR